MSRYWSCIGQLFDFQIRKALWTCDADERVIRYKNSSCLNQEDWERGKREGDTLAGRNMHINPLYIHLPGGGVLLIHTTRPLRTENSLLSDVLKSREPFTTYQSSLKIITIFIDY